MSIANSEKLVTRILSIGAAVTTIFLVANSVTDPVNTPKLVALGVTGTAAFSVLLAKGFGKALFPFKVELTAISLFITSMAVAVFSSESPMSQNLYGSYGRNNGMITYIFLAFVLLAALTLTRISSFEAIVKALLVAGLVNVTYCLWVLSFGDFIGWSNPYGNILGTLGNPNFIGSFLGIFFASYTSFALGKNRKKTWKYSLLIVLPVTSFEIYQSHAIQGRVVAALGIGILGFLIVRSKFKWFVSAVYAVLAGALGLLALMGALQFGPLAKYIYKTSVSLRGQYWLAGWNTGESHPITGVGMDSFGDWYRRSRDIRAIELPGVNTVVNAAHNVPLDMFAFGGWPLFLTYLSVMALAAVASIRFLVRNKPYDPIFTSLLTAWAGYQVQALISINQIGLAIWGWLLSGALIAYERIDRDKEVHATNPQKKSAKLKISTQVSPVLVLSGSVGALVGLLVALPPMISDANWRSAQISRSVAEIEKTMKPAFYNLPNSYKYLNNIQTLEESNLPELSHKYALQAVSWNPESFELWKVLFLVKNSTPIEKELALTNMKRLDPLNPDVTSLK